MQKDAEQVDGIALSPVVEQMPKGYHGYWVLIQSLRAAGGMQAPGSAIRSSAGHADQRLPPAWFSKELGRICQHDSKVLRVLKQWNYFWNLPKSQLAILLAQISRQISSEENVLLICVHTGYRLDQACR